MTKLRLSPVFDATLLSTTKVYSYNGYLYRFKYSDPYARPDKPRYIFTPLPGQRTKADLVITKNRLCAIDEVVGFTPAPNTKPTVSDNSIQLSLF